ncbi:MAG: 2-polyprenylphenol 6-hydroxylase [Pseudomonadota bacterium]
MISSLIRLMRIGATFRRSGALSFALSELGVGFWPRTLLWAVTAPLWPFGRAGDPSLPKVSRAISAMGPAYVKFGQILSTRPDIAGVALTEDLKVLQDRLPPFDDAEARRSVERELGRPIAEMFRRFDPPIAAASIAQVHYAETKAGRPVAVKVLRPGVERAFAKDIAAFYFVARLVERLAPKSRRLRPREVVSHFEGVVLREMDLRMEAAAGSEFAEMIRDEAAVRCPSVRWDLSAKRVLTTDWAEGDRLGDVPALRAAGVDLPELALRLMRLFLRNALSAGYFHADLHQGNVKIGPDGAAVIYDFGIMGRIDAKTRRAYAEILLGFLNRDYRRGAEAHFNAGYVPRTQNVEDFAQALRSIGEPIFGQQASDISMARVLQQLFEVTERFGMETRPELILLQRTMVVVEGVARSLDPDFDMWDAARPEVERFMVENLGPAAAFRDLRESARALARLGPRLPELAERLAASAEQWAQRNMDDADLSGSGADPSEELGAMGGEGAPSAAPTPRARSGDGGGAPATVWLILVGVASGGLGAGLGLWLAGAAG